ARAGDDAGSRGSRRLPALGRTTVGRRTGDASGAASGAASGVAETAATGRRSCRPAGGIGVPRGRVPERATRAPIAGEAAARVRAGRDRFRAAVPVAGPGAPRAGPPPPAPRPPRRASLRSTLRLAGATIGIGWVLGPSAPPPARCPVAPEPGVARGDTAAADAPAEFAATGADRPPIESRESVHDRVDVESRTGVA